MTPVHQFTRLIEHADEEMRIVHHPVYKITFAVDSNGIERYALLNNKVYVVEGICKNQNGSIASIDLKPYNEDEEGHTIQF